MFKYSVFFISLFFSVAIAQPQTLDRIVAIVGDDVILQSDVDNQYHYLTLNNVKDDGTLACQALDATIIQKMMLDKAKQDSVVVGEDEVDSEVNRRVDIRIGEVGNKTDFEKIVGMTIPEFKASLRDDVKNELLIDRQKNKILGSVDITPKEVQDFYASINADSLGLMPAEVEINHIVAIPPFSPESKKAAKEKLNGIRKEIIEGGADFAAMAKKYSDEPGSEKSGGSLGEFGRGMMVPAFEEVVYSMRPNEVSEVFETEFGYHIVKLVSRRGEVVKASHILLTPKRSTNGDSMAQAKLNEALSLIKSDSLSFQQAAIKYSEDRASKDCGGCVMNPRTGELRIPLDLLDADFFFKIEKMKEGDIIGPLEYYLPDGTRAFHLLYLKHKIPPHKPNLKDDYMKIYSTAKQQRQVNAFEEWMLKAKKNIFVDIKETECSEIKSKWDTKAE